MITSKTNKIIKLVKSLEKKKYQDKYGLYVLEGIKFVKDAVINKNHIIKYIITTEEYTEDYDDALEVDNEIFKYISST
ncbi:MAG: RNA methyltransferase, partial [Anaerofustis stercorihominis]